MALLEITPKLRVEPRRDLKDLLAPANRLAAESSHLAAKAAGLFTVGKGTYSLPRYVFWGKKQGMERIRLGLFAAIHGDEPAGARALVRLLEHLDKNPELAAGYQLFVYPVCNPTGYEDGTRHSRRGKDLNREFWQGSDETEVYLLEHELREHAFHGVISLHADDTSDGVYGFANGATLTESLLGPALRAAGKILPLNQREVIDGFGARDGIIRSGYPGMLTAPPARKIRPFEITLETPAQAELGLQVDAFVVALKSILTQYRAFISHAQNI
jgi:protein MpaA